jgi:uncharacterized membrane protein (UPF0127 family)
MLNRHFLHNFVLVLSFLLASCTTAEESPLADKQAVAAEAMANSVVNVSCEMDNKALRAMRSGLVTIATPQGRRVQLNVKIADNNYTRAQGFQRVCAERIAAEPILFVFGVPVIPNFHMNNVVAPIDIAFINEQGRIDVIHKMQVYGNSGYKPRYGPSSPVVAALEVSPSFFEKNSLSSDSAITWEVVKRGGNADR